MLSSDLNGRFGRLAACALMLGGLAACGGGSSSNTTDTTAMRQAFGVPSGETAPDVTYDETADTLTFTTTSGSVTLPHYATYDVPGFQGYYSGSTSGYAWLGQSPSKDLSAGIASINDGGTYTVGGMLDRANDGTIPTTGSASYSGHYVGLIQSATGTRTPQVLVKGDAALSADFDSGHVSGLISNRSDYSSSTNTLNDLVLETGSIGSNGTFSGTATGGEFTSGTTDTTSGGSYTGLFGGDNGSEVAGGVQIMHGTTTNYIETGAFIGN